MTLLLHTFVSFCFANKQYQNLLEFWILINVEIIFNEMELKSKLNPLLRLTMV